MKPRLLDLFCGAGGSAIGYHRAGFEVVGVDIKPQPRYPFEYIEGDALYYARLLAEGGSVGIVGNDSDWRPDAIHSSPPCQAFTAYRRTGLVGEFPDLIVQTRIWLQMIGLPYVIENVEGAPLANPTMLCGSAFGLDVRRHRLFETSFPLLSPGCAHGQQNGDYPQATNCPNRRKTAEIGVWRIPLEDQKRAMGVDWDCTLEELSQMVPPAYTEHLGHYLLTEVERRAKVAA